MEEKHLLYFKVLDSFKTKQCPVCFLVKDRIDRYFDNLIYENINDVGFRKQFRENQGFCNYHSFKFLSCNDGLAISITHRDLLIDIIEKLNKKDVKSFLRKRANKCIICELIKEAETMYISVIIKYLNDDKFKTKLLSSEGLCIPHYKKLLTKTKTLPQWFTDFHIKRYNEILTKLDKYLDSCNFSLGDKPPLLTDDEKLIWKKLVKTLFGFEGNLA